MHQIWKLTARLGEPPPSHPERILIIVELPPDHACSEFNVVPSLGPGQGALFLKHIVDVEDGYKPVVPKDELRRLSPHGYDVDRCQARNLVIHVGIRHPERLARVGALI